MRFNKALLRAAVDCRVTIADVGCVLVLENGDLTIWDSPTTICARGIPIEPTFEYDWTIYNTRGTVLILYQLERLLFVDAEFDRYFREQYVYLGKLLNYIPSEELVYYEDTPVIQIADYDFTSLVGAIGVALDFKGYHIYTPDIIENSPIIVKTDCDRALAYLFPTGEMVIFDQDLWEEFWALLYEFQQNLVKFLQAVDPDRYREWSKS